MSNSKAIRATIELGDIQLDVYRLEDKYFLSLTQVAASIDIPLKRMSQIRELKLAQSLYPQGFRISESVKVEGGTKPVQLIILDDVSKYWTLVAVQTQNPKACALLAASQAEALERRADAAFGILQTEIERNERFIARRDSILQRHFWVDSVKWYIANHPELSENYKRFIYSNVSDCLNRGIFGINAKQIRIKLDLDNSESIRDSIHPTLLLDVSFLEKYAATKVQNGCEPLIAIKEALLFCNYPIRCPITGQKLPTTNVGLVN